MLVKTIDQVIGKDPVLWCSHISELHWKPKAGLLGRKRSQVSFWEVSFATVVWGQIATPFTLRDPVDLCERWASDYYWGRDFDHALHLRHSRGSCTQCVGELQPRLDGLDAPYTLQVTNKPHHQPDIFPEEHSWGQSASFLKESSVQAEAVWEQAQHVSASCSLGQDTLTAPTALLPLHLIIFKTVIHSTVIFSDGDLKHFKST